MSGAGRGRPYYGRKNGTMSEDRIDSVHLKMWNVQVACYVLAAVVLFGTLVAASVFVDGGFPCFFAAVVDYSTANETSIRLGSTGPRLGGVVPVLFLETYATTFFFYAAAVIFLTVACFFIAGAVLIGKNPAGTADVGGSGFATSLVASSSTILMGTVICWLLQATVVVLAHRLIVLAAAVYAVYFGIFTIFFGYFCGRSVDSATYADDVSVARDLDSSFHRLVGNARAVMTNLLGALYGASIVLVCLMFGMLLANSFTTRFWHIIVITLVTTSVLTLIYLLVLELLAARYVHMLIGPYVGLLVGYGMLASATKDYMNRFYYAMGGTGSNMRLASQIVLGIMVALILIALLVRVIRASIYHRRRFTRAYNTAKRLRRAVKDRAANLVKRKRKEDRIPLRPALPPPPARDYEGVTSDEDVIYENIESVRASDSEWED